MSRKATEFQKKEMSRMYRGKEIFKPLNTGWIDANVACGDRGDGGRAVSAILPPVFQVCKR